MRTANAPIAALPVPLPTDVGIGELRESIRLRVDRTVDLTAMREGPTATLTAWREKGWTDDEVMLVLQAEKLSGIERLSKMLADLREQIPEPNDGSNDIDINVELGSLCAHADFVRMADVSRAAGFNKVTFRTPESVSSAKARSTGRQVLGGGTGGRRPGVWGTSQQAKAARSTIDSGLSWLVGHQSDRGFWSSSSFSDRCDAEPCEGAGIETLDIGVTGLSLLALVKAGHSVNTGEHKTVVRKGVKYLMTIQDPETGCFGEVNSHTTFLYDHAIATLAVVEIYGGSKWPMLKKPAQKAVNFILSARNDTKAWRYAYPQNGSNDMSVSGWMAMALLQAKRYGLDVDEAAFDGVRAFITEMTDEVSGRTGYQKRGGLSDRSPNAKSRWPEANTEAMTALATICRLSLGESPDSDDILRGAALLRAQPPRWSIEDGTIDYSYWYFGTRAATAIGGATWSTWQKALEASALDEQKTDSHACGSWDPDVDPWGARGGRVYSTALMTLCLLEYGQHLP